MGLQVQNGLVAVWHPKNRGGFIEIPDYAIELGEKLGKLDILKCQVQSSGWPGIDPGDEILVRTGAGCRILDHSDFAWIPTEYELRIYGQRHKGDGGEWLFNDAPGKKDVVLGVFKSL